MVKNIITDVPSFTFQQNNVRVSVYYSLACLLPSLVGFFGVATPVGCQSKQRALLKITPGMASFLQERKEDTLKIKKQHVIKFTNSTRTKATIKHGMLGHLL